MNRIDMVFNTLKAQHKTAFIGYQCVGDPDLTTTYDVVLEMERCGCDMMELGIPFSDPCAEGPIIQEAYVRALSNPHTTDDIMHMVHELRKETQMPIIYVLYYNQIFKYGCERFIIACANSGVDALNIPDLPFEHQDELLPLTKQYGIHLISLITPRSSKRKEMIAIQSHGFLNCVPPMLEDDQSEEYEKALSSYMSELNSYSNTPKVLGFGIANIEQITQVKDMVDGLIVDSAIVQEVAKIATKERTVHDIGYFVKQLSDACHNPK